MHASHLFQSANAHVSPEERLKRYLQSESKLTWTTFLFEAFPQADLYLVGGTVRDVLLGRSSNDIDLVVRGVEYKALEAWLLSHGAAEFVGRFGTFKFIPHGMGGIEPIDIALPRTEKIGEQHSSRSQDISVRFDPKLSIKEDLSRRDYTVNAMAFDVRRNRLIDPFLGLKDLEAGIIHAVLVPHERFYEDASRMIRGLRFASQLNFGIEAGTWEAMKANIHLLDQTTVRNDGRSVYSVPREVVGREFLRGFHSHPVHTLELWKQSGALHLFMPQLVALEDSDEIYKQTTKLIHTLFSSVLLEQYNLREPQLNTQVAALLLHPSADDPSHAYNICMNLHFHQFGKKHDSYVDCDTVLWLVKNARLLQTTDPASMAPSAFERTFLSKRGDALILLMHALMLSEEKHSVERERLHVVRRLRKSMLDNLEDPLISGRDIQGLDIEPGPHYRTLLDSVRDEQLKGTVQTKQQALHLLSKLHSA